jgi:hypothetical protein
MCEKCRDNYVKKIPAAAGQPAAAKPVAEAANASLPVRSAPIRISSRQASEPWQLRSQPTESKVAKKAASVRRTSF